MRAARARIELERVLEALEGLDDPLETLETLRELAEFSMTWEDAAPVARALSHLERLLRERAARGRSGGPDQFEDADSGGVAI